MPEYLNTSSKPEDVINDHFNPGEKKLLDHYINLNEFPFIKKLSDNPPIKNPFQLIFENISNPTNMSEIFPSYYRKFLKIEDGETPCVDDDYIALRVYVGDTDSQQEFVPLGSFVQFTRTTQTDKDGINHNYWVCSPSYESNIVPNLNKGKFTFFSVAVIAVQLSGTVNVLGKKISLWEPR